MKSTKAYISERCFVKQESELTGQEAEELINKVIAHIHALDNALTITFTDGSSLTCVGYMYDGSALSIDYEQKPTKGAIY